MSSIGQPTVLEGILMNSRLFAILTVLLMVSVSGVVISDDLNAEPVDSETNNLGHFNVYTYAGGENPWLKHSVQAYDGCIAVKTAVPSAIMDERTHYLEYGYETINLKYGDISKVGTVEESGDNIWNVLYYSTSSNTWVVGDDDAIGFYKPFEDYNINYRTANLALYYGTPTQAASIASTIPNSEADICEIVHTNQIIGNNAFKVTFNLKIQSQKVLDDAYEINMIDFSSTDSRFSEATLLNGVNVEGYGSDLYLALKNAIGEDNINGIEEVPGKQMNGYTSNYSWMSDLFALETAMVDDKGNSDWNDDIYAWWIQYTNYNALNPDAGKSDFVLGFYSPVLTAPNVMTNYTIVYGESTA